MTPCNFISLNVRGLKNQRKRRSIFCFLKDQKCDFCLLQETYSEPQDELIWKAEWRGDIFFSHGSNHQNGVCILLNPLSDIRIENFYCGPEGRIVLITTVFVDTRLWETKHRRKRFQNFRESCVLSTDRIEIHQLQPLV